MSKLFGGYTQQKMITVTKNLQNSSNNTMTILAISLIGKDIQPNILFICLNQK